MQFGFPIEITSGIISSLDVVIELSSKRVEIQARDIVVTVDAVEADNGELRDFLTKCKLQKLEKVLLCKLKCSTMITIPFRMHRHSYLH